MASTMITKLALNVGGQTSCGMPVGSRVFAVRMDAVTLQPQLLALWATDSFEYVTKTFVTSRANGQDTLRHCPSMLNLVGSIFDQKGDEHFVFEVL